MYVCINKDLFGLNDITNIYQMQIIALKGFLYSFCKLCLRERNHKSFLPAAVRLHNKLQQIAGDPGKRSTLFFLSILNISIVFCVLYLFFY